jgi:putative thioredoxin
LPEAELRKFIDEIAPGAPDDRFKKAAELESSQPKQAEAFYRQVLTEEPENEQARLGLARVLIQEKKDEEARTFLSGLGMTGEIGLEAERLRKILDLRKELSSTGDEATLRKRVVAEPQNARAKYELGSLLTQMERYKEALEVLLAAAELDRELARTEVRELMVKIWEIIGVRSDLADEYRDKLRVLLY